MKRGGLMIGSLLLMWGLLSLAGCADEPNALEQPAILKVADTDEVNFYRMYGDYMSAAFPDTTIEFISTEQASDYRLSVSERNKRWIELVRKEQPDLIVLRDDETYRALADEGLLADLSPYMQGSRIMEEQLHPGVIELMKQNRDGQVYGLAPTFSALQLYFNEDLFREYGIDLPHDGMTWEELLQLAYRFTAADSSPGAPIGYYETFSSPLDMVYAIGSTEGMSMYRLGTGKMTLDTPAWRRAFTTVLTSYKNGTFRSLTPKGKVSEDGETYYDEQAMNSVDLFSKGKAAMTLEYYGPNKADEVKFKLGSVNPPVDEATRTRSYSFYANQKLAIRSGSPESKAGWEFIQFMVSDYIAKSAKAHSIGFGMPSNMSYPNFTDDPAAAALYRQMPAITPVDEGIPSWVNSAFYDEIWRMLEQEMNAALADKQSVDEMLKRMQEQGQQIIDQAIEKGNASG
ncbi:extracellular solute-binding protein [Paenibacillus xylaniclasticus]|uniref:extracellular solute-binding protein n=1 Tax=Paenibacillus xylaniclasticus TaxID=588083 RepID=UPI000FDC87F9|nr:MULTISPECIES: extracellular solute-binding protein [Paenibacillus]GFN29921.1 hypothetical protein PCURB6_01810 [Paenibacillus curdlanolyticus]